jgi:hypothetical protein
VDAPAAGPDVEHRAWLAAEIQRHVREPLGDLFALVDQCLRNVRRVDGAPRGVAPAGAVLADAELLTVLIPELCERLVPAVPAVWGSDGTRRDAVRRVTSTLAEYASDPSAPDSIERMLGPERVAELARAAATLRARIADVATLSAGDLATRVRFALAGSDMARAYPPWDCVYEAALMHRVVPALVRRVLAL